jgi:hypothetical protein
MRTTLLRCTAIAAASVVLAIASQANAMTVAQPGHASDLVTPAYLHNYFGFYDDPTAPPLYIPPGCRQVFTPDGHARAICPNPTEAYGQYRRHHHHRHHRR